MSPRWNVTSRHVTYLPAVLRLRRVLFGSCLGAKKAINKSQNNRALVAAARIPRALFSNSPCSPREAIARLPATRYPLPAPVTCLPVAPADTLGSGAGWRYLFRQLACLFHATPRHAACTTPPTTHPLRYAIDRMMRSYAQVTSHWRSNYKSLRQHRIRHIPTNSRS